MVAHTADIAPALELASSRPFRASSETVVPAPTRRFGPPMRAVASPPPVPGPFERLAAWMRAA